MQLLSVFGARLVKAAFGGKDTLVLGPEKGNRKIDESEN